MVPSRTRMSGEFTHVSAVIDIRDYRHRLMDGLATAIDEKGYSAATIGDVVRHARVSKRTFYEHFADKEECFLACYAYASELALRAVVAGAGTGGCWLQRVRGSVRAYLATLRLHPALTRTLLLEVHGAGQRALVMRRRVLSRFSRMLCDLVDEGRKANSGVQELSPAMSTALVGGINELVLYAVEHSGAEHLGELEETIVDLVVAVLRG